ncbi:phage terminase small subunit P27 family [Lactococcus garvieae]|uniref:Phage terminase, small subunit, putative, P27 family n=1 Tax=Lactococcus garvieae TaxID=1363 RepID=A0A1I4I593_9LACT|nr:phage terminase small subunit P27 family [Lactococcus garvieae]SFL49444.1 phage terminase, small subunit, putative, P27 family [Lactococcus garvieae]
MKKGATKPKTKNTKAKKQPKIDDKKGRFSDKKASNSDKEQLKIRVTPPSQLPVDGRTLWGKIIKNFESVESLTKIDEPNLELFCANYAMYRQALESVKKYGIVIETDTGLKKNPAVGVIDTATKTMRALSTALGFDYQFREKVFAKDVKTDEIETDILEVFKID